MTPLQDIVTNALTPTRPGAFSVIAGMTPAASLEVSDVRIYCDNDEAGAGKRWQLMPDPPGAGKKPKNSERPFDKQRWWDPINRIYQIRGSRGAQSSDGITGVTYRFRASDAAGQNPDRETITVGILVSKPLQMTDAVGGQIGDSGLKVNLRLLGSMDDKLDLTLVNIESFGNIISATLFHEVNHATDLDFS